MARRKLMWKLLPSYLVIIMASILVAVAFTFNSLRNSYIHQAQEDLSVHAGVIQANIRSHFVFDQLPALQERCERLGQESQTRITVVMPNGDVIADSEEHPSTMDNHAGRPEIRAAMKGSSGSSIRFSDTQNQRLIYVAEPLVHENKQLAIVRVAQPIAQIDNVLGSIAMEILFGCAIVAMIAALASWFIAHRISRPLNELRRAAEKYARGELDEQLVTNHSLEIDALAETMGTMARQLDERVDTAMRQKNEQEAVFSSMVEGVLAVDKDGCLISINQTAAKLFNVDSETAIGQSVNELIRNSAFQTFLDSTLNSNQPTEEEITFHVDEERIYQAHGAALRGSPEENIGAVIVLNDITRLRRLERVRSDFVSNVSHELRTPVTSIKGFVETLIENPPTDKQQSDRFLEIISNNATQLNSLINDLLSLSRIEQGENPADELFESTSIKDLLAQVQDSCDHSLQLRSVRLKINCDSELQARVHPSLLQQAVLNLVDNAIKYSNAGQEVVVDVELRDSRLIIQVTDSGAGISQEHLPRLFERFYRVDKARSREQGGTGLGLAIVKHIAELHGGKVSVDSTIGSGSTFRISIPQR